MNLKNQGIGQLAHVVETPLRPGTFGSGNLRLLPGDPGLPYGGANSGDERDRYRGRCRDTCSMADYELAGAISPRSFTGRNRQRFQVPPNVFRKLLYGRVPPLRLLAQRHQHDVVQVPRQSALQLRR